MKTKYKFIHFEEIKEGEYKGIWQCKNNKSNAVLGHVSCYKQWKEYIFAQYEQEAIFSKGCLLDIVDFMDQLINGNNPKINK